MKFIGWSFFKSFYQKGLPFWVSYKKKENYDLRTQLDRLQQDYQLLYDKVKELAERNSYYLSPNVRIIEKNNGNIPQEPKIEENNKIIPQEPFWCPNCGRTYSDLQVKKFLR